MKHQCLLEEVNTKNQMVAWIELPSGYTYTHVDLLDGDKCIGTYRIKEVYLPALSNEQLHKKQTYDRRGFPSLSKV